MEEQEAADDAPADFGSLLREGGRGARFCLKILLKNIVFEWRAGREADKAGSQRAREPSESNIQGQAQRREMPHNGPSEGTIQGST